MMGCYQDLSHFEARGAAGFLCHFTHGELCLCQFTMVGYIVRVSLPRGEPCFVSVPPHLHGELFHVSVSFCWAMFSSLSFFFPMVSCIVLLVSLLLAVGCVSMLSLSSCPIANCVFMIPLSVSPKGSSVFMMTVSAGPVVSNVLCQCRAVLCNICASFDNVCQSALMMSHVFMMNVSVCAVV